MSLHTPLTNQWNPCEAYQLMFIIKHKRAIVKNFLPHFLQFVDGLWKCLTYGCGIMFAYDKVYDNYAVSGGGGAVPEVVDDGEGGAEGPGGVRLRESA